jgi:hypothetical protein
MDGHEAPHGVRQGLERSMTRSSRAERRLLARVTAGHALGANPLGTCRSIILIRAHVRRQSPIAHYGRGDLIGDRGQLGWTASRSQTAVPTEGSDGRRQLHT